MFLFIFNLSLSSLAQKTTIMELPYEKIPEYPANYNAGNVIARFIDGLGYRYYWATEGLTENDLKYIPSEKGRTMLQTIEHLYGLSVSILNAPQSKPNIRPYESPNASFEELRKQTLLNLKQASELLSDRNEKDIEGYKVIFQTGERRRDFPFWNMINGQISDAIYHVGQIVSFRRSSGNPMNPKVNVFLGETRE